VSWAENEKLNEWIQRAYENGREKERKVITEFLISELHNECNCEKCGIINELVILIGKGAE
jgi:hypothetical protein